MNKIKDKKRALVVCPGRGSYTKDELGYIYDTNKAYPFAAQANEYRKKKGQESIFELDAMENFSIKQHLSGENAAGLIYVSSYLDFLCINRHKYDLVAITGNSMGWYTALSLAGAVRGFDGFELVNTMGSMMPSGNIGHQVIYPIVDDHWQIDQGKVDLVHAAIQKVEEAGTQAKAFVSIEFGGYLIVGVNEEGSRILRKNLPTQEQFPLKMAAHAAFHTPLLREVSEQALKLFSDDLFCKPSIPAIDGRGHIWQPYSSLPKELREYTLGDQVVGTYSFSKALEVGLKEFSPDVVLLLGPGANTGGAIAQSMIAIGWDDLKDRDDFMRRQNSEPILLSMGREDQRPLVT